MRIVIFRLVSDTDCSYRPAHGLLAVFRNATTDLSVNGEFKRNGLSRLRYLVAELV